MVSRWWVRRSRTVGAWWRERATMLIHRVWHEPSSSTSRWSTCLLVRLPARAARTHGSMPGSTPPPEQLYNHSGCTRHPRERGAGRTDLAMPNLPGGSLSKVLRCFLGNVVHPQSYIANPLSRSSRQPRPRPSSRSRGCTRTSRVSSLSTVATIVSDFLGDDIHGSVGRGSRRRSPARRCAPAARKG
jgi:hypothetical protein